MTMGQFIDMCILLGCDYCDSIRGIGPKKAFEMITKHKSIENILKHLDTDVIVENSSVRSIISEVHRPGRLELCWSSRTLRESSG